MTDTSTTARAVHTAALMHAQEVRDGKLSRREFLVRTTSLGVSAAVAYGLLGLEAPAQAQDAPVGGVDRGHVHAVDRFP